MSKVYDFLIRGGLVVTGSGIHKIDVGIKGEQIISVDSDLPEGEATRMIEASGKYILPGAMMSMSILSMKMTWDAFPLQPPMAESLLSSILLMPNPG